MLQVALDSELSDRFDRGLNALAHRLEQILFSTQIASIYSEDVYTVLLGLLTNMSPATRQSNQQELESEVSRRLNELERKEEVVREEKKKEQEGYIRTVQELLGRIEATVKIQTTIDGVEQIEKG